LIPVRYRSQATRNGIWLELGWDGNREVLSNKLFTINIFMIFSIYIYDVLNLKAQKYL